MAWTQASAEAVFRLDFERWDTAVTTYRHAQEQGRVRLTAQRMREHTEGEEADEEMDDEELTHRTRELAAKLLTAENKFSRNTREYGKATERVRMAVHNIELYRRRIQHQERVKAWAEREEQACCAGALEAWREIRDVVDEILEFNDIEVCYWNLLISIS